MEFRRILFITIGIGLIASMGISLVTCEESPDVTNAVSNSETLVEMSKPIIRRRIVRKRVFRKPTQSPSNVTASVTGSESGSNTLEPSPTTEVIEDTIHRFRRPLLRNLRPSFMNRARKRPQSRKRTEAPLETPSSPFKFKLKQRKPFSKLKLTTTTADPTTTINTMSTRKPFPVKKLLRRLKSKVFARRRTTTPPTVSEEESSEESSEELSPPVTVPVVPETPSTSTTTTTTTTQAPTTTTTTTKTTTTGTTTPSTPIPTKATTKVYADSKNSSMIIIPVPPSQRKPYHPVIMQVTKTPPTANSLPETRVVTYKLNKMFVPMGIYGKVLPKSTSAKALDTTSQKTIVSTPLPFLLQGQEKSKDKKSVIQGPHPEIKVKGHRSKEVSDSASSGDSSSSYARAVKYAATQREHHLKQQRQWEVMVERLKKKERNMADSVSLTYNYKPNPAKISLTTEKVNVNQVSLTSEAPFTQHHFQLPNQDNRRGQQPPWAGHKNGFHDMTPPRPLKPQKPTKTIFETISDAASSIPGLIHGGLSTLSGYGQAFDDEAAFPKRLPPSPVPVVKEAEVKPQAVPQLDSETLEYFRKRPYLLKNRENKENFLSPEFSSGFKPVTVPPHFASQYYASTPTTVKPSYKSSTPSYSKVSTTPSYESVLRRDPLFQQTASSWKVPQVTTPRTPKHYLSDSDISTYRKAVLGSKGNHDKFRKNGYWKDSMPSSSSTKSFAAQWLEFNNKYSRKEINEAKEGIAGLFARSRTPTYEDMMFMKPPSPRSGSAFDDLLKMFKLGFSFGAGHTSGEMPSVSYRAGTHNEDSYVGSSSDWVPLTRAGGNKIISFNAGITFGKKASPPGVINGGRHGSHFSSGSSPFHYSSSSSKFQNHYNKGAVHYSGSGNSHYSASSGKGNYGYSHGSNTKNVHSLPPVKTSPTPEFLTNIYYSSKKPKEDSNYQISPAISTHFDAVDSRKPSYFDMTPDAIRNAIKRPYHNRPYSNDPPIEIIPSSQFFREKGKMKDIAAVIKPPEMSDDLVKAALPPQIASVPQLSYPTQQLIQNPNNFKSLSQLQSYFATAQPRPTSPSFHQQQHLQNVQSVHQQTQQLRQSLMNQHHQTQHLRQNIQNHHHQTQQLQQSLQNQHQQAQQLHPVIPNQQQLSQQLHQHIQNQHQQVQHQQVQHQQVQHQQVQQPYQIIQTPQPQQHQIPLVPQFQPQQPQPGHQIQNLPQPQVHQVYNHPQHGQTKVTVTGDGGLGFSNFELPPGLDPDIASLIKTELDKDDIPEEFRKDFLEAQQREKQQKSASQAVPSHLKPGEKASKRIDKKPDIKFHRPIPITPTMLTPVRGKPIRASPVPRYVVELARKLKKDKDVQGIVRVSTKRDKGPPVEYLYPVRG